MMMIAMEIDFLHTILRKTVILPGDRIIEIAEYGDVAIARTDSVPWRIERQRLAQGIDVYTIAVDASAESGGTTYGVARLEDGSLYVISEPGDFALFWQSTWNLLEPTSLAEIFLRFQDTGSGRQVVIHETSMLGAWHGAPDPSTLPGFTLPTQQKEDSGRLSLAFCSLSLEPRGAPFDLDPQVYRWEVTAGQGRNPNWVNRRLDAER